MPSEITIFRPITWISLIAIALPLAGCPNITQSQNTPKPNISTKAKPKITEIKNGSQLVVEVQTTPSVPKITDRDLQAIKQTIENRIQGLGISEAIVKIQGKNRLLIQVGGEKTPDRVASILESSGFLEMKKQKLGTEKQLSQLMQTRTQLETDRQRLLNNPQKNKNTIIQTSEALEKNELALSQLFQSHQPPLTSRNIKDASSSQADPSESWVVAIQFDEEGSKSFAQITKELAGTGRAVGIFVDGKIISSPFVSSHYADKGIMGGAAEISGDFTSDTAKNLATQLQSGALILPIKIVEMTSIPAK
ncbi:preprotein translocase subunit SecD [Calothrix sp. 336/3]|uniref:preprotein translocase subunit SecD n=1 Tax=Calothrix sp. 336/3 TaxID=1337936 RepID=UPI00069AAD2B|nr:hypothetical protein [Calothrix sp. 336/3]